MLGRNTSECHEKIQKMIQQKEKKGLSKRKALSEIISFNNNKLGVYEQMEKVRAGNLSQKNSLVLDQFSLYILNLEEYRCYSEVHQYYQNLKLQLDIEYEKIRFIDNAVVFNNVVTILQKGNCDVKKLTELEGKVNEIK